MSHRSPPLSLAVWLGMTIAARAAGGDDAPPMPSAQVPPPRAPVYASPSAPAKRQPVPQQPVYQAPPAPPPAQPVQQQPPPQTQTSIVDRDLDAEQERERAKAAHPTHPERKPKGK